SAACAVKDSPERTAELAAFAPVQAVLEANCVHCHGDNRLSTMPSIHDSRALAALVRAGGWITPGKPEASRFYQVVSFPDEVPGAMPPTGHAIRAKERRVLKDWITQGAKVPAGKRVFVPRGQMPRSV
ncbi:MAG: hypothetical protein LDL31_08875, partial [Prosthecobacter sp.]|nr:hypothetical protein [Prosthecobacter sp.]